MLCLSRMGIDTRRLPFPPMAACPFNPDDGLDIVEVKTSLLAQYQLSQLP